MMPAEARRTPGAAVPGIGGEPQRFHSEARRTVTRPQRLARHRIRALVLCPTWVTECLRFWAVRRAAAVTAQGNRSPVQGTREDIVAKKKTPAVPPSPEAREHVLFVVRTAAEPLSAKSLAKSLLEPYRIAETEVARILDDYVAVKRLHRYPPKTAKGPVRYWDRDLYAIGRAAVLEANQDAEGPLTAVELVRRLMSPVKFTVGEVAPILDDCVAVGTLHEIPPATARGRKRYWNRNVLEFGRQTILKILDAKGPQTEASLKRGVKWLSGEQFQQIYDGLIGTRAVWRHPPLGKAKTPLIGRQPPLPEPYLEEVGRQLSKSVAQLIAANVAPEDVRRALVQLIEAAGISFGSASTVSGKRGPAPESNSLDLLALIRRVEPRAERGALVGARDLRRAAGIEKAPFDRAVLELARQGKLSLHRHDYPSSLSPSERDELVADGNGAYYVGVALRITEAD